VQELGITSDEALSLEDLPKRAVVLGGGCVFIFFMFLVKLLGISGGYFMFHFSVILQWNLHLYGVGWVLKLI